MTFGPLMLKAVRAEVCRSWLGSGILSTKASSRIRLIFKWGVENELVEPCNASDNCKPSHHC